MGELHLITDVGFGWRFLQSLTCIVLVLGTIWCYQPLREAAEDSFEATKLYILSTAHRHAWWSAIGLLSSSCCVIQIGLNMLNWGCVGFNTVLGPLRPTLLAASLVLQAACWAVAYPRPWLWAGTATSSALAVGLTFMPEMLDMYSRWRSTMEAKSGDDKRQQQQQQQKPGSEFVAKYSIPSLGCASCEAAIRGVLNANAKVAGHSVSAPLQRAEVEVLGKNTLECTQIAAQLAEDMAAAGFPADLLGVEKKGATTTTTTAASAASSTTGASSSSSSSSSHDIVGAVLGGLLGSSCCALQLGLNFLTSLNVVHGIGCAGFNKTLGPLRPYLRTCTAAWLGYAWLTTLTAPASKKTTSRSWGRLLFATLLCGVLTLLPEMLLMSGGPALAPPVDGAKLVKLNIDGMGCEACQTHVQAALQAQRGVIGAHVDFEAGSAEVWVQPRWGFDYDLTQVKDQLEYDGYEIKDVDVVGGREEASVAAPAVSVGAAVEETSNSSGGD